LFIFCNPPYSEYEEWVSKILNEASGVVYLVIPDRWVNSAKIQEALKYRDVEPKVLMTTDFLNAESLHFYADLTNIYI
jgi:hypothetical protein